MVPDEGESRGGCATRRGVAAVRVDGVGGKEDHPTRRLVGADVGPGVRADDRARSDDERVPGGERDVTAVDAQDLLPPLEVEEREEVVGVCPPRRRVRSPAHPVFDADRGESGRPGEVDERDGPARHR
jgi:hypothetical protein